MKKVFRIVNKISEFLGILSMVLIVFMLLLIVVGVIARVVFKAPISGAYEIVQIALALMIFASLSYTQVHRRHICISMLINLFPEKGRFFNSAVMNALGAGIGTVIAVSFFQQGMITLNNGQSTQTLFIPMYPVYFAACLLMAVYALTLYVDVIKSVLAMLGDKEYQEDLKKSWV